MDKSFFRIPGETSGTACIYEKRLIERNRGVSRDDDDDDDGGGKKTREKALFTDDDVYRSPFLDISWYTSTIHDTRNSPDTRVRACNRELA